MIQKTSAGNSKKSDLSEKNVKQPQSPPLSIHLLYILRVVQSYPYCCEFHVSKLFRSYTT